MLLLREEYQLLKKLQRILQRSEYVACDITFLFANAVCLVTRSRTTFFLKIEDHFT